MVAVSFLILYLELALIRWVAGYVRNFGYFTNFAMLAAFLGTGVGCLLARRAKAIVSLPGLLLALALIVRVANIQIALPVASPSAVFWSDAMPAETQIPAVPAVLALFVLISAVFVGLGQILGELFGELPRLRAYGLNVLGGLAGIVLFAVNSGLRSRASRVVRGGGGARAPVPERDARQAVAGPRAPAGDVPVGGGQRDERRERGDPTIASRSGRPTAAFCSSATGAPASRSTTSST